MNGLMNLMSMRRMKIMNREIKYRGQRTDNKQWVYGYYFKTPLTDEASGSKPEDGWFFLTGRERHCIAQNNCVYEVIPETVGRDTWLKDKNGIEIYESDICRQNNDEMDLVQVCFGEFGVIDIETEVITDTVHGWYLKVIPTDEISKMEPFCNDMPLNEQWIGTLDTEVIGNIYENSELLEIGEAPKSNS